MRKSYVIGLAAAIAMASAGWANANFVAYNDCVWLSGQYISPNATAISGNSNTVGSSSGLLKDFATGANTSVTATLQWNHISYDSRGADCAVGTDARNTFDPTNAVTLVGMGPTKGDRPAGMRKSLSPALTRTRNTSSLQPPIAPVAAPTLTATRGSCFRGADFFTNASSSGVIVGDAGASATLVDG